MLLKNRRKEERKGDKLSPRYLGPYTVRSISARGQLCIVVQILLIGYVKFFAKVSLVNMKGVELKVKHSVRNVKKFIPPSELKLMEIGGTSKFIQYTTFCIKVCNVMLDCGAD